MCLGARPEWRPAQDLGRSAGSATDLAAQLVLDVLPVNVQVREVCESVIPADCPQTALVDSRQAPQLAWPLKYALVCGDELVALQRGCHDDPIRRVAVHVRQLAGANGDGATDGNLDQPLSQQIPAPGVEVKAKSQLLLLKTHADFPERNGGDCGETLAKLVGEPSTRSRPQPLTAPLMPQEDMGV